MISECFPANSESLEPLGQFLARACSTYPQPSLLELAVAEMVTNSSHHGRAQWIKVRVKNLVQGYEVALLDNGSPFNPLKQRLLPMGELREGGYGLPILHRLARNMRYRRYGAWNCLTMQFEGVNQCSGNQSP